MSLRKLTSSFLSLSLFVALTAAPSSPAFAPVPAALMPTARAYRTASRPPVRGRYGMDSSVSEIASQTGAEVLKRGGNAIDAAVAVGLALSVVWPSAGNLGGGGFMVIRLANGKATTIDYREMGPARAHRNVYLDKNGEYINESST